MLGYARVTFGRTASAFSQLRERQRFRSDSSTPFQALGEATPRTPLTLA
jgi:hypothetical protein